MRMLWMQTFTGKKIDIMNPKPEAVDIQDIAHALSMICRFGGHCRDFYSVAEHSLLVERLGTRSNRGTMNWTTQQMEFLLHDAAEAYVGDTITPIKNGIRETSSQPLSILDSLENSWALAIGKAFGLGCRLTRSSSIVKEFDDQALSHEIVTLFYPVQSSWRNKKRFPFPLDLIVVNCWSPAEARRRFLVRFQELHERLQCQKTDSKKD